MPISTKTETTNPQSIAQTRASRQTRKPERAPDKFIYALELYSGKIAVGQTENSSRDISLINSGYSKLIPDPLQVRSIIGIKDVNEERTLPSVVAAFCADFGEDRIICVETLNTL